MTTRHCIRPALVVLFVMAAGLFFSRAGHRVECGPDGRGTGLCAAELPEGLRNFFQLQKLYTKWNEGLFGSRRYQERKLWTFLVTKLGREFTTESDYMLLSPEGVIDKQMVCVFQNNRWLYIHGDLDEESFKTIPGITYDKLKHWWRTGILVAVTGTLRKFKLDWDAQGDIIHIYLEKVTVIYEKDHAR